MKRILSRIVRSRALLIAAGLLAAYAACGFLLLPYLVERYVPQYARDTLKREASVGRVRINPFLLTFEANNFRLADRDGTPLVALRRLYVDFQTSSLLRWAWVFADITIDGLDVHVVTRRDGSVNLLDLAALGGKSESRRRMLLQHVALTDGLVTYSDLSGPVPAETGVAPINLELRDISTLPNREGPYTVRATLPGGGTIGWRGEVELRPLASDGELTVEDFRPATIWRFVQRVLRLDPPAGQIAFTTHYSFKMAAGRPQLQLRDAHLRIAGLSLRRPGAASPLLALQKIEASGVGLDLQRREVTVTKLEFRDGNVATHVAPDGTLDWQTIAVERQAGAVPAAAAPDANPWNVSLNDVQVAGVAFRGTDATRAVPAEVHVGDVAVRTRAKVEIGGARTRIASDALHVELSKIALKQATREAPLASIDSVTLEGEAIDSASREVALRELDVRGGQTTLTRDAHGEIDLLAALRASSSAAPQTPAGAPWRVRLGALKLSELRIGLVDQGFEPALVYDLEGISATLKNLGSDPSAPVAFELALKVAQGGNLAADGSFLPGGSGADARVQVTKLALVPLQPALARYATLVLKSGALSGRAALQYRAAESSRRLRASGSLDVADLRLDEAQDGAHFLSWKTLAVNGVHFDLAPDRLAIADVRLVEPGAKLTVFKDHSVNLAKVWKKQEGAAQAGAARGGGFPVTVERVRVQAGTLDYADLGLVLPFAAHVTRLEGSATGLSSDPASRADMKLEGRVEPDGLARVNGALSPFAPKRFTDLHVDFRNVAMRPLTPYSATFAGRRIDSGRLRANLEYKINDGKLLGSNKLLLDRFTLGARVESPDALHLPLDLAIALLTDAHGRIDVAVPVQGDVDDPHFAYGHLIRQAIATLIKNIVTAPFRALGALLGGAGQLDAVSFDPGSDRVLPTELDKLRKVAEALAKRPQLKVIVEGRYNTAADGEALRDEKVRREVAAELGEKLEPGEKPGPVAVDSAKTQLALEKLLAARSGEQAMAQFQEQFEKRAGRKASRVNRALAFFGKGSADHDFYEALYKRLVALHPLDAAELNSLAQRRATAVQDALVVKAQVDAARVATGKTAAAGESKAGTVDTKLSLDVLKGARPRPQDEGPANNATIRREKLQ